MIIIRNVLILVPMFLIWVIGIVACMCDWNRVEYWAARQWEEHFKLL